jgi:hypothetical protein
MEQPDQGQEERTRDSSLTQYRDERKSLWVTTVWYRQAMRGQVKHSAVTGRFSESGRKGKEIARDGEGKEEFEEKGDLGESI